MSRFSEKFKGCRRSALENKNPANKLNDDDLERIVGHYPAMSDQHLIALWKLRKRAEARVLEIKNT